MKEIFNITLGNQVAFYTEATNLEYSSMGNAYNSDSLEYSKYVEVYPHRSIYGIQLDTNHKLHEHDLTESGWFFRQGIVYLAKINEVDRIAAWKNVCHKSFQESSTLSAFGMTVKYLRNHEYGAAITVIRNIILKPNTVLGWITLSDS